VKHLKKTRRRYHFPSLLMGFALAIVLVAAVLVGGVYFLTNHVVRVNLDSEAVALLVRDQIVSQAHLELPKIIEGAKAEIPGIVEKEMEDQLSSDRMEIAGFVFRMPEELMAQLKHNMQANVENATGEILDGIDTALVADQFGEDVYTMVRETMKEELDGRTFTFLIMDRLPLTVQVHVN
jgi:hypothetical protein